MNTSGGLLVDHVSDYVKQMFKLRVFLRQLGRDLARVVAITKPCVIASLLITVLLTVFDRGAWVLYQTIKFLNLLSNVLRILVEILCFFTTLLS